MDEQHNQAKGPSYSEVLKGLGSRCPTCGSVIIPVTAGGFHFLGWSEYRKLGQHEGFFRCLCGYESSRFWSTEVYDKWDIMRWLKSNEETLKRILLTSIR
jgi:hypothetical protein